MNRHGLADNPEPRLHLRTSTAEIEFTRRSRTKATFTVSDLRPVEVCLAGVEPGSRMVVDIEGARSAVTADADGVITLTLPPRAAVEVSVTP